MYVTTLVLLFVLSSAAPALRCAALQASGFFVSPSRIVTSYHHLQRRVDGYVFVACFCAHCPNANRTCPVAFMLCICGSLFFMGRVSKERERAHGTWLSVRLVVQFLPPEFTSAIISFYCLIFSLLMMCDADLYGVCGCDVCTYVRMCVCVCVDVTCVCTYVLMCVRVQH